MLILAFLFFFSKSNKYLSSPGFYSVLLFQYEQLDISLSNGQYDCILFWSHTTDNDANIIILKSGKSKFYNLIGETTAIIKGDKATISISIKTTVHVWIIKKDVCNMYSILYTTPQFVKGNFKVKDGIDNLCLFFGNHNNQTKISLKPYLKSDLSKINVFSENSLEKPIFSYTNYLTKQFNFHFFVQITNPNGSFQLDFEISGQEPKDTLCDHLPIHMISIDGETEKDAIEETTISCVQEDEKEASIIPFILILFSICALIVSASIIYQTGYYKKIIAWWRGEIINDGPVKIEIDPKDLLRIDDIEDDIGIEDEIENENKEIESTSNQVKNDEESPKKDEESK